MARRPKHPRPYGLLDLTIVPGTDLYQKKENGITYQMPLELTRLLKEYYRYFKDGTEEGTEKYPTMQRWYRDLKKEDKKKVIRLGNLPKETNDFYPDAEWEE
jgi:hypothetical protein